MEIQCSHWPDLITCPFGGGVNTNRKKPGKEKSFFREKLGLGYLLWREWRVTTKQESALGCSTSIYRVTGKKRQIFSLPTPKKSEAANDAWS